MPHLSGVVPSYGAAGLGAVAGAGAGLGALAGAGLAGSLGAVDERPSKSTLSNWQRFKLRFSSILLFLYTTFKSNWQPLEFPAVKGCS